MQDNVRTVGAQLLELDVARHVPADAQDVGPRACRIPQDVASVSGGEAISVVPLGPRYTVVAQPPGKVIVGRIPEEEVVQYGRDRRNQVSDAPLGSIIEPNGFDPAGGQRVIDPHPVAVRPDQQDHRAAIAALGDLHVTLGDARSEDQYVRVASGIINAVLIVPEVEPVGVVTLPAFQQIDARAAGEVIRTSQGDQVIVAPLPVQDLDAIGPEDDVVPAGRRQGHVDQRLGGPDSAIVEPDHRNGHGRVGFPAEVEPVARAVDLKNNRRLTTHDRHVGCRDPRAELHDIGAVAVVDAVLTVTEVEQIRVVSA